MASNMAQLQAEIMQQVKAAMKDVSKKALEDMYEETMDYYAGTEPSSYKRTGALGNTPSVGSIEVSGTTAAFDAYLDTNYTYDTGDQPNMGQVLDLANYGTPWTTKNNAEARPTIGKKGFWERAQDKMEKTLDTTMKKYFD